MVIHARHQSAMKYFEYLMLTSTKDWLELYTEWEEKKTVELGLALISPRIFKQYLSIDDFTQFQHSTQHVRNFSTRSAGHSVCNSFKLWNYYCPLARMDDNALVPDHLFPYAEGGPTIAENCIWLCRTHNTMKINDIHVYPWEEYPPWLDNMLKNRKKFYETRIRNFL